LFLFLFFPDLVLSILSDYRGQRSVLYTIIYILGLLLTIVYWYFLSCLAISTYDKLKDKMRKVHRFNRLIVAGIIVGIIISISVLLIALVNHSQRIPPEYRGFSKIKPIDWKASTAGYFYLVLINKANSNLTIPTDGITVQIGDAGCINGPRHDIPIVPEQEVIINFTCSGLEENYNIGEYYRANIDITYIDPASGMTYHSVGECQAGIE